MSDSLVQIGVQIVQVVQPVIAIVGAVGNSLNIAVLTRPTLYHHACSRYFLALAINNLFYSSFIINQLLSNAYHINIANYAIVSCKIISYTNTVSAALSPYLIVCASIDRYCTSSANALIRRFSSIRIAQWMICIVVAVFSLFFIHILIFSDLPQNRSFSCSIQVNSVYSQVYIIVQVFLIAVVPPSLMAIFGSMTIQNSNRPNVVRRAASRYNRTEHQLARMLFVQVTVHIFLTLPTCITYLISIFPNTTRTTTIFYFAFTILEVFFNCSYVTPFFLYILSGRVYREELRRLIYKLFKIRFNNRVVAAENQTIDLPVISQVHPNTTA